VSNKFKVVDGDARLLTEKAVALILRAKELAGVLESATLCPELRALEQAILDYDQESTRSG
jgi:hypothetical protein